MGRWSRHPMGSDGALDAKDSFMMDFDTTDENGNEVYYFERDPEEIKHLLADLSLDQLEDMAAKDFVNENRFVIPYTFVEFHVHPTKPEIKQFLLECLDYTQDFEEYGNGDEDKYIQVFKDNFEDIIAGKKDLDQDPGLLASIADAIGSGKIVNKTKDN